MIAGIVDKMTPIAGDEKVTLARCLNLTEGGFFIRAHKITRSQITIVEMMRTIATKLNKRM